MVLSTWYVFSYPLCLSFQAAIPMQHPQPHAPLWKCCATFASSSPLCSLPKASAMSQLWVALPAQLCPTHIPWGISLVSARLIPFPLPPSTCLYITLVIPALSHALTSLHVLVVPLLWLYPAGTFHHGGSQSFTPSPLGSQRPLLRDTWGYLDALLEHSGLGARGMLWGRGAGGKDLERGASGCVLLSVLRPWDFCASPSPLGWCLPLAQPPCRQQTQPIPHHPLPWCQCPTKAGWEPSMGRR